MNIVAASDDVPLDVVKARIEKMGLTHQQEVLRMLSNKDYIAISQNQNGSFVNLSNLRAGDIRALIEYVNYVDEQQTRLDEGERCKAELREEFFNEDKAFHSSLS